MIIFKFYHSRPRSAAKCRYPNDGSGRYERWFGDFAAPEKEQYQCCDALKAERVAYRKISLAFFTPYARMPKK